MSTLSLWWLAALTLAHPGPVRAPGVQEEDPAPRFPSPPADFEDREHTNRLVQALIRMANEVEALERSGVEPSSEKYLELARAGTKVAYYMAFAQLEVELREHREAMEAARAQLVDARAKHQVRTMRRLEDGLLGMEQHEQELEAALSGAPSSRPARNYCYELLRFHGPEQGGWRRVTRRELPNFLGSAESGSAGRPLVLRPFFEIGIFGVPIGEVSAPLGLPKAAVVPLMDHELDPLQASLPMDSLGLEISRELGLVCQLLGEARENEARRIWDQRWDWIMAWEPDATSPVNPTGLAGPVARVPLRMSLPHGVEPSAHCDQLRAYYKVAAKPKSGFGKVEARRREQLLKFATTVVPLWQDAANETVVFADLVANRAGGVFHIFWADVRGGLEAELVAKRAPAAADKLRTWLRSTPGDTVESAVAQQILAGLQTAPKWVEERDYTALEAFLAEGRAWLLEGSKFDDAP